MSIIERLPNEVVEVEILNRLTALDLLRIKTTSKAVRATVNGIVKRRLEGLAGDLVQNKSISQPLRDPKVIKRQLVPVLWSRLIEFVEYPDLIHVDRWTAETRDGYYDMNNNFKYALMEILVKVKVLQIEDDRNFWDWADELYQEVDYLLQAL